MPSDIFARLGILAELARQARLGRTALMKILFFLQESPRRFARSITSSRCILMDRLILTCFRIFPRRNDSMF